MSKTKKNRREISVEEDKNSNSNKSDDEQKHHTKKQRNKEKEKPSGKKKRHATKEEHCSSSSSSTSSASSSSGTSSSPSDSSSSDEDERKQSRKINAVKNPSEEKLDDKSRRPSVEAGRKNSSVRGERNDGQAIKTTQHGSKWDSPERRRRNSRSRSCSRNRNEHRYGERERTNDGRGARQKDERDNRSGRERYQRDRSRSEYGDRGRVEDRRRQNNRERDDANQYRGGDRRHDERDRDQRNRYNDRRGGDERRRRSPSRSPRRGDNQFKRGRRSPVPHRNQRNGHGDDDKNYEWGKKGNDKEKQRDGDRDSESKEPVEKEKPNFGLSGALTEDTNKVNGVVIKYAEPPEARKPKRRWRLYPFKGETALPTLHIHRQSCFLVGRERKVVDLAVDHPSCSKQHAALQYRLVPFNREDGSQGKRVRLYVIDLESANGTFLNNKKIDARKYYELMEKDVLKFGFSTREYVLLHESSKEDLEDDDVDVKEEPVDDAPAVDNTNP